MQKVEAQPHDSCRLLSIRPLTHASPHAAAPLVDATPPPGGRSLRDRQRVAVVGPPQSRVDGNRVARGPPDHFSPRLRRPGGLGGPVLALKAQRGCQRGHRISRSQARIRRIPAASFERSLKLGGIAGPPRLPRRPRRACRVTAPPAPPLVDATARRVTAPRAEPAQCRVDGNRVARRAARPFLDPSAPSRWSRWSRLSRAGPEGAAGDARGGSSPPSGRGARTT